jgi:hypothetical protein
MIPALENLELEETGRGGNTIFDISNDIWQLLSLNESHYYYEL